MPYVDAARVRTYYEEHGRGDPIVLLQATPNSLVVKWSRGHASPERIENVGAEVAG
jgi:hypothetical protein